MRISHSIRSGLPPVSTPVVEKSQALALLDATRANVFDLSHWRLTAADWITLANLAEPRDAALLSSSAARLPREAIKIAIARGFGELVASAIKDAALLDLDASSASSWRTVLALHPKTPEKTLQTLFEDPVLRALIFENPSLPLSCVPPSLQGLSVAEKRALTANPALALHTVKRWLDEGGVDARDAEALLKNANLDGETALRLASLAQDRSSLYANPRLTRTFYEKNPPRNANEMLAAARNPNVPFTSLTSPEAKKELGNRQPITREEIDVVLSYGGVEQLAANPTVPADVLELVAQEGAVLDSLAKNPGLSTEVAARVADRALKIGGRTAARLLPPLLVRSRYPESLRRQWATEASNPALSLLLDNALRAEAEAASASTRRARLRASTRSSRCSRNRKIQHRCFRLRMPMRGHSCHAWQTNREYSPKSPVHRSSRPYSQNASGPSGETIPKSRMPSPRTHGRPRICSRTSPLAAKS